MKIKVSVSTGKVGSECVDELVIDDEEVEGMDDAERTRYIEDAAKEMMWGMVEWDWEEVEV